jgi:hypothetical protein
MDKSLQELIRLAAERGSNYIKSSFSAEEVAERTAELGVFLLSKSERLGASSGEKLRMELNEIQNKIDHFRRMLYHIKGETFKG